MKKTCYTPQREYRTPGIEVRHVKCNIPLAASDEGVILDEMIEVEETW